jgi:large subunit ribosomal protein L6
MSRIGKKPVPVPAGVTATIDGQKVVAKGPKGELSFVANDEVSLKLEDNAIVVTPVDNSKDARSKWGMSRTMVSNILTGVKDGYERKLEINGVGYRAAMQGQNLQLALGFSHDVVYQPPKASTSLVRSRRKSSSPASTSRCWARLLRRSAPTGAPNPTRARA